MPVDHTPPEVKFVPIWKIAAKICWFAVQDVAFRVYMLPLLPFWYTDSVKRIRADFYFRKAQQSRTIAAECEAGISEAGKLRLAAERAARQASDRAA